jgi:hypothetical protein
VLCRDNPRGNHIAVIVEIHFNPALVPGPILLYRPVHDREGKPDRLGPEVAGWAAEDRLHLVLRHPSLDLVAVRLVKKAAPGKPLTPHAEA